MAILETKKQKSNKGLAWSLIVIVLAIVVVYGVSAVVKFLNRDKVLMGDKNREVVAAEELPGEMPVGLPYLNSGQPVENYVTKDKDQTLAVRTMYLHETLEEAKNAYLDYFGKFGWEVGTDYAQNGVAVLAAQKDGQILTVSFEDTQSHTVLELTLRK